MFMIQRLEALTLLAGLTWVLYKAHKELLVRKELPVQVLLVLLVLQEMEVLLEQLVQLAQLAQLAWA
jgi:hypothetical protein